MMSLEGCLPFHTSRWWIDINHRVSFAIGRVLEHSQLHHVACRSVLQLHLFPRPVPRLRPRPRTVAPSSSLRLLRRIRTYRLPEMSANAAFDAADNHSGSIATGDKSRALGRTYLSSSALTISPSLRMLPFSPLAWFCISAETFIRYCICFSSLDILILWL